MKKWKYKVVASAGKNLETTLNEFGEAGWELVAAPTKTNLIFKRSVQTAEVDGKNVERLRKSEKKDTGPALVAELSIQAIAPNISNPGMRSAVLSVQCPDIGFQKDYEYQFQWTASMMRGAPSPSVNYEHARQFAESELRKDLEKMTFDDGKMPSQMKWV